MPDWNSLATPHTLQLEGFSFSNGDNCHIKLHCRTLGALNRAKDNAVLLLHGTTGSSVQFLQPGMADALFNNGQPLDYSRYFLLAPDAIGHGESSKPSTTGGTNFPQYSYTDIVKAQHRIVQDLFGLQQLRLILGTSMGGMNTWMWGYLYPDVAKALMPVACLPQKLAGQNLLFRRLMLAMIEACAERQDDDTNSLSLGVGFAWNVFQLMVNSPAKLGRELTTPVEADQYITEAMAKGRTNPPLDVLWEFRASFDYDPANQLQRILAPLLTVNFADDQINAPGYKALEAFVAALPHGRAVIVDAGERSLGHQTLSRAEVWQSHVADLLAATK
jgi:homoserine O-acetyltransferase/O-succinyltransferase